MDLVGAFGIFQTWESLVHLFRWHPQVLKRPSVNIAGPLDQHRRVFLISLLFIFTNY